MTKQNYALDSMVAFQSSVIDDFRCILLFVLCVSGCVCGVGGLCVGGLCVCVCVCFCLFVCVLKLKSKSEIQKYRSLTGYSDVSMCVIAPINQDLWMAFDGQSICLITVSELVNHMLLY